MSIINNSKKSEIKFNYNSRYVITHYTQVQKQIHTMTYINITPTKLVLINKYTT